MDMAELEKRITTLEDIEAIKKLKARYCAVCDNDHNPDQIITLFADDGIWEGAGVGRQSGARRDSQTVRGLPRTNQLLAAQRDESDHRGQRRSRHRHWYFLGPFTMRKRQPRDMARRRATKTTT